MATPERQVLLALTVETGTTVGAAIERSGIGSHFPGFVVDKLAVGLWGQVVDAGRILRDGDRVELYRPLTRDPRDARRALAAAQRLGSSS